MVQIENKIIRQRLISKSLKSRYVELLQSYHMLIAQTEAEELPTVSVNPYFSFGPVTKAISEMKQHMNEFSNDELVKVAKTGEWLGPQKNIDMGLNCHTNAHHSFHDFAVNKMTFCQLDESKSKRQSIKGESASLFWSFCGWMLLQIALRQPITWAVLHWNEIEPNEMLSILRDRKVRQIYSFLCRQWVLVDSCLMSSHGCSMTFTGGQPEAT